MAKQSKNVLECDQTLSLIKGKQFKPIYILHGEEPYFCDRIANALLENVVPKEMQDFNQFLLYGRDITGGQILDLLQRSPVGSPYFLVVIREAQGIKGLDLLVDYFKNPVPSTIFVLNFSEKIKPGRGKSTPIQQILAAAKTHGLVLEFPTMRDYEVAPWIELYLKNAGYTIEPQAAEFLVYQMGTDIAAISNQLQKLLITLPEGTKTITRNHLSDAIGVSRDFNPFELTKAIGQGNLYEANRIAINMAANPKENNISLLLASIHSYFVKVFLFGQLSKSLPKQELAARLRVHPYFLDEYSRASARYDEAKCLRIFEFLRTMDLRTKGLDAEPITLEDALKETLQRIIR